MYAKLHWGIINAQHGWEAPGWFVRHMILLFMERQLWMTVDCLKLTSVITALIGFVLALIAIKKGSTLFGLVALLLAIYACRTIPMIT